MKYVRFACADERSKNWRRWIPESLTGIITEARIRRDKGQFNKEERKFINALFKWYNDKIPCPPWKAHRGTKWSDDAMCWWKITAKEAINKMRPLIALLRKHGLVVRTMYSNNPGKIVYEDKYQIVAEWDWKNDPRLVKSHEKV